MAKKVNSVNVKGVLELNFEEGLGRITEITKDDEIPYNLFEILNEFNSKTVTISIKEEKELEPIEE